MKILWKGPVMNPTGIATASREMVKALAKRGHTIRAIDVWNSAFDFNEGLDFLNDKMDKKDVDVTIVFDYPQYWSDAYGIAGKPIFSFIHEGTKMFPGWVEQMNAKQGKLFVCSKATKNLFKWNMVKEPAEVISYGFNPELYKIREDIRNTGDFVFLSVNSWTGNEGDRKGTDLLIKAFDEEFKGTDAKLLLKISTFWSPQNELYYQKCIDSILGHKNENIIFNCNYVKEEKLAEFYNMSDVFVAPTRGEGFGLTILNSLASGCPVIVTKDNNSGHMDFCKNNPGVLFIDAPTSKQGDPTFYIQGNMLAEPDFESLKKQMRYAFDNREKLKELGKAGSEFVKDLTWDKCAEKLEEFIK